MYNDVLSLFFFIHDQDIHSLNKLETNPRWFVGTSMGRTAGLWNLMFLHTQRQWSNFKQLVKGEWVLIT